MIKHSTHTKTGKKVERHTTKDIQMTNKHRKGSLASLVIRKTQIKITAKYYYPPPCMAKFRRLIIPNVDKEKGQVEFTRIAGGRVKWSGCFGTAWQFLIKLNILLLYDPAILGKSFT